MENKELYKRYSILLLVSLFAFLIVASINPTITGFAPLNIDPLGEVGGFLGRDVSLLGRTPVPAWAVIVAFAMVFSVVFILVKKIHIFKDEDNKAPAIIFALAVSIMTTLVTNIVGIILYLSAILGFFIIIATILLIGWASYLGVHTSISSGLGEISETASGRYQAKSAAKESKRGLFETLNAYEKTKEERKALGGLRKSVYNKDKELIQKQLMVFDSLNSSLFKFDETIKKINRRIARESISNEKKTRITPLLNDIETLRNEFASKVNEVRTRIEGIKASIKENDFASAENQINGAINTEQQLENIIVNLAKKESEINRILLQEGEK